METDPHQRRLAVGPASSTILDALRAGSLDPELAGLLWLLLDAGVPLVVAGPGEDGDARAARAGVLAALLDLAPPSRTRRTVDGRADDFRWLADAERLGWRRSSPPFAEPDDPSRTLLLAAELGGVAEGDLGGDRARLLVRALGRGFALGATAPAAGLEELLDRLRGRPAFLSDDELSRLGVVLVLGAVAPESGAGTDLPRIVAGHYLRPLALDVHGHSQRLPPAVLATWDEPLGRFEHFAWGVATELAGRAGLRTGDFEAGRERRAEALAALAPLALPDRVALVAALDRARAAAAASAGHDGHRH